MPELVTGQVEVEAALERAAGAIDGWLEGHSIPGRTLGGGDTEGGYYILIGIAPGVRFSAVKPLAAAMVDLVGWYNCEIRRKGVYPALFVKCRVPTDEEARNY